MIRKARRLTPDEIQEIWGVIETNYEQHLAPQGVKRVNLKSSSGGYNKDALVLVYLAQGYPNTRWVTKEELTDFVRQFYPNTNDVQQARHLGPQKGYFVKSTVRGNHTESLPEEVRGRSAYKLESLEKAHPNYSPQRRTEQGVDFESLKAQYANRCATCGSEEGKPNLRYPQSRTSLQAGHRNPHLPLEADNIIPQCQFCNRADRNWWVYDERGRVVGVASATPVIRSIDRGYITRNDLKRIYEHIRKILET